MHRTSKSDRIPFGVRFAPSPTGHFHVGNFRTAWISHLLARELGQPWIMRFEDIDQPRVMPGAMEKQIEEMKKIGLVGDEVLVQSQFHLRHLELFEKAVSEGKVYRCDCSRKEVIEATAQLASAPHVEPPLYNGHCRHHPASGKSKNPSTAWRFKMEDESGYHDFIIARTHPDGSGFVPAYNWACAIDDHDGGYSVLVRAWDLAHVAGQQRAIHAWISEHPAASVFHTSLVTQNDGKRLEKRTPGVTLSELLSLRDVKELVSIFGRSFDRKAPQLSPGSITGEAKRSITLSELGL